MRTLLELLSGKPVGDRRYDVEGIIVFEFTPAESRECSAETGEWLQHLIRLTDMIHPWRDRSDYDGQQLPSIHYLGDADCHYQNFTLPELHVGFRIVPTAPVRKAQVHAYEKYLEKLAEQLAKQITKAVSVRSVFRVSSVAEFKS